MTTNSLLSVTVTALVFTAACKSDFQAGGYSSRESDASATPPDSSTCPMATPKDEQSCVNATCVPHCDSPPIGLVVSSAPGGPLLADVRVTNGPCFATPCPRGCDAINVSNGLRSFDVTCDLVAVSTDGRSQSFRVAIVRIGSPTYMCCGASGFGVGPGQWVESTATAFDPPQVVVDFNRDGGVPEAGAGRTDGAPTNDGGLNIDGVSTGPTVCRAPSPNYGPTSSFERLPDGTRAAAQTCPAACGDSAWPSSGPPNTDIALPYGTCTPGTADCSALAEVPCACGLWTGPVDGFNCSCEGGTWICRIFAQGTAICMPCPDAGVGDGLNLAGLTALTVTSDPLTYGTYPPLCPLTGTSRKDTFSLDLGTRVFNWDYCSFDFSTSSAYQAQAARQLTNLELTAVRLMIEQLSTNYNRITCGWDKEIETLDLTFGDRIEKYQDDFYGGCSAYVPADGRTYLHYMDGIVWWLRNLSWLTEFPRSFTDIVVGVPYPSKTASAAAVADATAACGDTNTKYTLTSTTREFAWSSCVSPNGLTGHKLQTGTRILSDSEFALVLQSWSQIQLGATGDCSTPRPTESLHVTAASAMLSDFANDFTACNRPDNSSSGTATYVVGLDDLTALLTSLAK